MCIRTRVILAVINEWKTELKSVSLKGESFIKVQYPVQTEYLDDEYELVFETGDNSSEVDTPLNPNIRFVLCVYVRGSREGNSKLNTELARKELPEPLHPFERVPKVMRGTVKQGRGACVSRSGTAGNVKSEGRGSSTVKAGTGGGRRKANSRLTSINPGVTVGPVGVSNIGGPMVIKQESGVDLKPDPDSAGGQSPSLNGGDDGLKSMISNDLANKTVSMGGCPPDMKIKSEMVNGVMGDGMKCLSGDPNISGSATTPSSSPPTLKPEGGNCAVSCGAAPATKPGSGTAGVATSDAQYMQQQSQIFVFTTQLANKAAEAVMGGAFLSIIEFHCSQPATKKLLETLTRKRFRRLILAKGGKQLARSILEFLRVSANPKWFALTTKHPLKVNQFARQNPAPWMSSMPMKGNKGAVKGPVGPCPPMNDMGQIPGMGCMPPVPGNGSMPQHMMNNCMVSDFMGSGGPPMGPNGPGMMGPNPNGAPGMMGPNPNGGPGMLGPRGPMMMHPGNGPGPGMNPNACGPGGPPMGPMSMNINQRLQGVIVPDEQLTPEQRQHRLEQMARLRQMQALLLPELHSPKSIEGGAPTQPVPPVTSPCSSAPSVSSPSGALSQASQNTPSNIPFSSCGGGNNGPPAMGSVSDNMPNSCQSGPCLDSIAASVVSSDRSSTELAKSSAVMTGTSSTGVGGSPNVPATSSPSQTTLPVSSCAAVPSSIPPSSATTPTSTSFSVSGSTPPCVPCTASTTSSCAISTFPSSQMSNTPTNMGPSPLPRMGPSPGLGSSPIMGHSPGMGPSPTMGPSPGLPMQPGMMSSQANMMSNNMMMSTQGPIMSGPMGPGPSPMRFMGPGGPMMMDPNSNPSMAAQMDWQRMQVEFFQSKRKKGGPNIQMGPEGHMGMMGPMGPNCAMGPGGPMGPVSQMGPGVPMGPNGPMPNHMMGNSMCGNMGPMGPGGAMRPMGPNPNNRLQGPPPPYHGPRPMGNSATSSPGSPIMGIDPSPRMQACGPGMMRMDSPRSMGPNNPPTPVNMGPETSPLSMKDQQTPVPQSMSNDMPFGRQLQSFAQQKQQPSLPPCGIPPPSGMGPGGGPKEPSLMPVPSPQQIQYLNTFDGQELTIQKQPNNSLREGDIMSPMNASIDSSSGTLDAQNTSGSKMTGPSTPQGGPGTPHTPSDPSRFTGAHTPDMFPVPSPGMAPPSTPQQQGQSDAKTNSQRYGARSPLSNPGSNAPANASLNSSGGPKTPSSFDSRFPVPSPKTPGMCSGPATPVGDMSNSRFPGASPLQSAAPGEMNSRFSGSNCSTPTGLTNNGSQNMMKQMAGGFSMSPGKLNDIGPTEFTNPVNANLPLNPNCTTPGAIQNTNPGKMFDPISSMAQMSQQLTSTGPDNSPIATATTPNLVPGPVPMQGMPGGPTMGGPPGLIDNQGQMMGMAPVSSSPTMMSGSIASPSGPRGPSPGTIAMMGAIPPQRMACPGVRPMGNNPPMQGNFNGANVQVKPNAPNTIQYLPARPQANNLMGPSPRGPTSMEFMQRHSTPISVEKVASPMFSNCSTPNSICTSNVPLSTMSMSVPCGAPMNVPGGPMCSMPGSIPVGPNGPGVNMNPMTTHSPHFSMSTGPSGPIGAPNGPMTMGPNGPMSNPMGGMGGPMMGPGGMGPGGPMMTISGPMGMNPSMMMSGPMGPNGQMMGPRGGVPMMRGPSPVPMMGDMYGMPGVPSPNMSGGPQQPGAPSHPNQNQMMVSSGPMYGPKGSPVNMGMGGPMGGGPDTAQPLPPSMGQSGNFKNAPMMGPNPNDPAYAVQFHNFQQQLYATNTRGPMGPMGGPMGPHPGVPMSQGPVGPMMPQNFPFNAK